MSARSPIRVALGGVLFPLAHEMEEERVNVTAVTVEEYIPGSGTTLDAETLCCSCLTLEDETIGRSKFPKGCAELDDNLLCKTNNNSRVEKETIISDNIPPENRLRKILDEDSACLFVQRSTGTPPFDDQIEAKVPCNNVEAEIPLIQSERVES